MQFENNLEKLNAQKPEGATIVAVKGDRVTYFKETDKDRLLTFNRTMWVKTWFTPMHMNEKHFDFISVIQTDRKPIDATHTDDLGEYWKHENGKWFTWLDSCQQWKRIINFEPFIKQFNIKPL